MRVNISPDQLFELAKESVKAYSFDLTDESVSTDDYLKMTCYSVLEQFQSLSDEEFEIAALSSITALILENFLLNFKMMKGVNNYGNQIK